MGGDVPASLLLILVLKDGLGGRCSEGSCFGVIAGGGVEAEGSLGGGARDWGMEMGEESR